MSTSLTNDDFVNYQVPDVSRERYPSPAN